MKESSRGCAISYLLYLAETFALIVILFAFSLWWIIPIVIIIYFLMR